jgi:hypothetical protein
MSLINGIIPKQAFELIRDRIAEILSVEMANQFALTSNTDFDMDVWVERFVPFDKEELPTINVSLATGSLAGHTQKTTEGTYTYFVDVHAKAVSRDDEHGDSVASIKLHRLIGVCRAILENPRYKTLSFDAPLIFNRHCESISIAEPGRQDAVSSVMGRISFVVKAIETVELLTPVLIGRSDTQVKLFENDRGYFYSVYA